MDVDELPFYVDRAKGGRANCKGCKQKCLDAELRIAKVMASPYSDDKKMKSWYHLDCLMAAFVKQRPTTKRIDGPEDIGNWENISEDDKELILDKLKEMEEMCIHKYGAKAKVAKKPTQNKNLTIDKVMEMPSVDENQDVDSLAKVDKQILDPKHRDNLFREFRRLCADVTNNDAYTAKTAVVKKLLTSGSDGSGFKGDLTLWCRLLLPGAVKRVYNLKSKQLVKLFSRIFNVDHDDMLTDLENGDVAETIRIFFEKSPSCRTSKSSILTMNDVDAFLEKLSTLTKEDEQIYHFKTILNKCTSNDLKMIIRLVKGDLRINAGPKHILEAVHPDAYKVFQTSRDITSVISKVTKANNSTDSSSPVKNAIKANVTLMTPVLPMLAEACKSIEMAMKKCPNGMLSEIKYDGERVQLHKQGSEFKYYSRALKPVMPHKINRFKDFIPKAFPHGKDLILDAEVLMVDTETGKPLPFGSLGAHKKSEFQDAEVCLFVFDCIYYNDEILINKPMRERRKILEDNMIEIKNHIMFSEMKIIRKPGDLANMIAKVLKLGLEGLVLKDLESAYKPGKRHWLKVKKDYLFEGAMADSADLVVLGAWFGTGKKGGMLSVFLMGCYDKQRNRWLTVTKVHTGHDDKTLEELQEPLKNSMDRISKGSNAVPPWLLCTNTMVPDFIARNPKKQPVWEITGTEFTKAQIHTADGISVRFPRVTKIRNDKSWDTATNLEELKMLYKNSKENTDVSLLRKIAAEAEDSEEEGTETIETISSLDKKSPENVEVNRKMSNIIKEYGTTKVKTEIKKDPVCKDTIDNQEASTSKRKQTDIPDSSIKKVSEKRLKVERITVEDTDCEDVLKECNKIQVIYSPLKPLPNIFNKYFLRLYPDNNLSENVQELLRHWIAFGGKVVNGNNSKRATHVVHFTSEISLREYNKIKMEFSRSARHLTVKWLIQCIRSREKNETRSYHVVLKSHV